MTSADIDTDPPAADGGEPLRTDADLERRVGQLVGRALSRQLWLMFLDADDRQLPLLMPIDELPTLPSGSDESHLGRVFADVMDLAGAGSILLVLERPGGAEATGADTAWARTLHRVCGTAGVPLRAILLAGSRSVRRLPPDDYVAAVS